MPRDVVIGIKTGVGPILQIVEVDTGDPLSTPDAPSGELIYSSENLDHGYADLRRIDYDPVTWPPPSSDNSSNTYFVPSGSGFSDCIEFIQAQNAFSSNPNRQSIYLFLDRFAAAGLGYVPIVERRDTINISSGEYTFDGPNAKYEDSDTGGGGVVGYVQGRPAYFGENSFDQFPVSSPNTNTMLLSSLLSNETKFSLITTWELPVYDEPLPDYSTTPTPGQEVFRIDETMARLARPGYDINDNNPYHFIFHEGHIPAKILAAGEVTISQNSTVKVTTRLPPSPSTYMDFIVRRQAQELMHPPFLPAGTSQSDLIDVNYTIVSDGVEINNNQGNQTVVVRYMILADDDSLPTTGGEKIFYQDNDGTEDFFQIKVPGSSDAPSVQDILFDSRFPPLQIAAEGYIDVTTELTETGDARYGANKKTVSFSNDDGLLTFVKYSVIYDDRIFTTPYNRRLRIFNGTPSTRDGDIAGNSVNCRLNDTSVEFFMSRSNPTALTIDNTAHVSEVNGAKPIGIRYYVFLLPPM